MADHGVLYKALDSSIINGMKKICSIADYILPNISEACFLTDMQYKSEYSMEYIQALLEKLYALGCKNIILTGVEQQNKIRAAFYNGQDKTIILKDKVSKSYHGTGDIFSSVIVANILNGVDISTSIDDACTFVINSIKETINDKSHNYGVHFEQTLKNQHFNN